MDTKIRNSSPVGAADSQDPRVHLAMSTPQGIGGPYPAREGENMGAGPAPSAPASPNAERPAQAPPPELGVISGASESPDGSPVAGYQNSSPSQEQLLVVCAWCEALLQKGRPPASHGICRPCKDRHYPEIPVDAPEPILGDFQRSPNLSP